MTKVIMHGCNGKMGQMITGLIEKESRMEVVAGIDASSHMTRPFPVFQSLWDCDVAADVVIDFSVAGAVDGLLDYCSSRKLPCVLCTTGLSEEQLEHIKKAAEETAVLKSANMSLGVNMLFGLLQDAARVLAPAGFDIEIVEKHHNLKVDAPSGTALALADVINAELRESCGGAYEYVFDRSTRREKRPAGEIGISAIRGGTIVGDHDVIFAGEDEVITISHSAHSKAVFAKGAIAAAAFLKGKPAGLYSMAEVIQEARSRT
ncbi:MAG: 4-hydroxy-tetrahydrodipicolinate reductase [Lachnospiraceae bacterium]|nr:4-hydroxy-tetrahydrodipicolinate reductase [Lachnospiraceae bacterium]